MKAEAEANKEYESDVDEDERALAQAIRDRSKVIKKEVRHYRTGRACHVRAALFSLFLNDMTAFYVVSSRNMSSASCGLLRWWYAVAGVVVMETCSSCTTVVSCALDEGSDHRGNGSESKTMVGLMYGQEQERQLLQRQQSLGPRLLRI